MIKIGIRFKFIFFTSLLIATIGLASSWFFSTQTRSQLEEELKKRGYSLIAQLAQDGEVKDSMTVAQKAFFEEPITRLRNLDIERELAYWRVLLTQDNILLEEKEKWIKTEIDKIPVHKNIEGITTPVFNVFTTDNGEQFYNFVVPIHEKRTIAEEEFAAHFFGLEEDSDQNEEKLLGIIQIGLTPERINKKMQVILWTRSIPLGFIIVLVGICVSYFIASGVVKPVKLLVKITDKVASGDLSQKVEINSKDEIGLLASQFNQMTKNLKQLIDEKEGVMDELKNVNRELSLINNELVQKNEQLNEAQEQLVRTEKLAAVGTLASGVSHELRNPLSAIKNAVFLLKRKLSRKAMPDIDGKTIQFLDIMDNEIDRCSKIINDLLGFTRVSKPTRFSSDINVVVNEALSRVVIAKNIKLTKILQPNLPMIMIDANQIDQVLINLVENACQAMVDGGELKISSRVSESFMEIEISDSGCGIPEKEVKKIFDPLFTTKPRGTGIGLAVCHGIMQKHNGAIKVKSQEGIGTKMFIRLPLEDKDAGSV
ncbi:MAG: HAMP domain-containing protein [Candidatus Scalindua rubra]|uniref:histidine kinase n=1 Tax=Candidatus Scalindua brodae TaxID=237368 RepID=A0A0B0EJM2_9BACT|nr:MAG: two-component sensor kinase [Candidatus Scalindua brodae]MBZ0107954.1 HAMP domain-containing protein [Candidatus Scalindua rubra]TWU31070.1 Sensor protein ZraS [Candidatus Brocadiaceae bacterium S225]